MPTKADTLYSNGPINGTLAADAISAPYVVSDSFMLASNSTISDISNVGIWVVAGSTIMSVSWSITTAPDSGVLELAGTGPTTATELTPTTSYGDSGVYNVYNVSFAVTDLAPLSAGSYYLNLFDGVTSPANTFYWDVNEGPSSGYDGTVGEENGPFSSESFEIDGTVAASTGPVTGAPEPDPLLLISLGLAALFCMETRERVTTRRLRQSLPETALM